MSSFTVSSGGPFTRSASLLSPSGPDVRARSVRVRVSGLYWKTIRPAAGSSGFTATIAPLRSFGEPGKPVTGHHLACPERLHCASRPRHRPVTGPDGYGRQFAFRIAGQYFVWIGEPLRW